MNALLKDVSIAFCQDLFTPGSNDPTQKLAWTSTFIFAKDSDADKTMLDIMDKVAHEKWGKDAAKTFTDLKNKDKICYKDGDTKIMYGGFEGNMFVSARNGKCAPQVLNRDLKPITESQGLIAPGCIVNALIDVWAQDNKYGKRINALLLGVQYVSGVQNNTAFEALPPLECSGSEEDGFGLF